MNSQNEELLTEFSSHLDPVIRKTLTDDDCFRFIRARKGDIHLAVEMCEEWYRWWNTILTRGVSPKTILDDITDPNEEAYTRLCPLTHMVISTLYYFYI